MKVDLSGRVAFVVFLAPSLADYYVTARVCSIPYGLTM
jgi:hypothetical protein